MKSELARRIVFTLGALLVFRLGSYIPLPGVSTSGSQSPGVSVVLNIRFSIFALWILPYLSAAILIQLLSMVSSKLSALARSGETGRRKIWRYTVGLTICLTAFQARRQRCPMKLPRWSSSSGRARYRPGVSHGSGFLGRAGWPGGFL
jgi:preprotein translocase subunit SecY